MADLPLRVSAQIPNDVLDLCRRTAYELYKGRNYQQAEVVCRGLLAADHLDWYHHALAAACLQKLGRFPEALTLVDEGLRHLPGQPRLLGLRAAITRSAERAAAKLGTTLQAISTGASAPPPAGKGRATEEELRLRLLDRQHRYQQMLELVTALAQDQQTMKQGMARKVRV